MASTDLRCPCTRLVTAASRPRLVVGGPRGKSPIRYPMRRPCSARSACRPDACGRPDARPRDARTLAKRAGGVGCRPSAAIGDPPGIGEVVEGDGGADPGLEQPITQADVVVESGDATTHRVLVRSGSTPARTGSRQSPTRRARRRRRSQRFQESQASPLGSVQQVPSACSQAHQSLFQLPPSIWCAAVAVDHSNPSGNCSVSTGRAFRRGREPKGSPEPCARLVSRGSDSDARRRGGRASPASLR